MLCLQSNASEIFLQTCIDFGEQRLNISRFKGSIIPEESCTTPIGPRWNNDRIEYFYQQITYHITHLNHNEQDQLKSKVRRIYENYIKIRIPYKYKTVFQNLSQNKNSVLLSQDKGKGRVKPDRTECIEKCMNSSNSD